MTKTFDKHRSSPSPLCFSPPKDTVMAELEAHHEAQQRLCDCLECLADGLPNNFDAQCALSVCRQLMPTVIAAHRFEENTLFHYLPINDRNKATIERLRFEHWEDEASGEDLVEAILNYVHHLDTSSADKLSYMIRGFFDNLRRHIAFETEHVLPLVNEAHQGA